METDERVLQRLRQAGGLKVEGLTNELRLSVMGAPPVRFHVKRRARLSDEELDGLLSPAEAAGSPTLLITRALTPQRRERLLAHDISWVEYGTGLVHLRAPGVAVDLPEDPQYADEPDRTGKLPGLSGKAGVIVEVLLELVARDDVLEPSEERGLIEQSVVARLSESDQGWVSRTFSALVEFGALEEVGSGPYKRWRVKPDELLDLWIRDGGPKPKVTHLFVWSRGRQDLLKMLAQLDAEKIPYAVGGVAAADLYVPTLTERPDPEIWIPAALPPATLARALDGEVIESGSNMKVWQASADPALLRAREMGAWKTGPLDTLRLVSPPRAVVEAARGRGRANEVSDRLRREIFTPPEGPNV